MFENNSTTVGSAGMTAESYGDILSREKSLYSGETGYGRMSGDDSIEPGSADSFSDYEKQKRKDDALAVMVLVNQTDFSKLDNTEASALYKVATRGLTGGSIVDEDGSKFFPGRASSDPRKNLELLKRFVNGEHKLIISPEYEAYIGMSDEEKFQTALKFDKTHTWNAFKSNTKGERGTEWWRWLGGGTNPDDGMVIGGSSDFDAEETRKEVRNSSYDTMDEETKKKYRADVMSDYEKTLRQKMAFATYLTARSGLSDRASQVLASSIMNGTVNEDELLGIDKNERSLVLGAFKDVQGEQTVGYGMDLVDANGNVNNGRLALYEILHALPEFIQNTKDWAVDDLGPKLYLASVGSRDYQEMKQAEDYFSTYNQLKLALEKPLPESDGFLEGALHGVAQNWHWIVPYLVLNKAGAVSASATGIHASRGISEMGRFERFVDWMKFVKPGATPAGKVLADTASGVSELANARNAAYSLAQFSALAGDAKETATMLQFISRQNAAIESYLNAVNVATKARRSALLWDAAGTIVGTSTEFALMSQFAKEYIENAMAAGVPWEDAVFTSAGVGFVNSLIESIYVFGLESNVSSAEISKFMGRKLLEAYRERKVGAFVGEFARAYARDAAGVAITEGAIEEPLQQLVINFAAKMDELRPEFGIKQSIIDALKSEILSGKGLQTYLSTALEMVPSSVGFGVFSMPKHLAGHAYRQMRDRSRGKETLDRINAYRKLIGKDPIRGMSMVDAFAAGDSAMAENYDLGVADALTWIEEARRRASEALAGRGVADRSTGQDGAAKSEYDSDEETEAGHDHTKDMKVETSLALGFAAYQQGKNLHEIAKTMGVPRKVAEVAVQAFEKASDASWLNPTGRVEIDSSFIAVPTDDFMQMVGAGYNGGSLSEVENGKTWTATYEGEEVVPEEGVPESEWKKRKITKTVAIVRGSPFLNSDGSINEQNLNDAVTPGTGMFNAIAASYDTREGQGAWARHVAEDGPRVARSTALRIANGWRGGPQVITVDDNGNKRQISVDALVYLTPGRLGMAPKGSLRASSRTQLAHEMFHVAWGFFGRNISREDKEMAARHFGIDTAKPDWELELEENLAPQFERYVERVKKPGPPRTIFEKISDKAERLLRALGVKDTNVVNPKTGRPYDLADLYEAFMDGRIGSGWYKVQKLSKPEPEVKNEDESHEKKEAVSEGELPVSDKIDGEEDEVGTSDDNRKEGDKDSDAKDESHEKDSEAKDSDTSENKRGRAATADNPTHTNNRYSRFYEQISDDNAAATIVTRVDVVEAVDAVCSHDDVIPALKDKSEHKYIDVVGVPNAEGLSLKDGHIQPGEGQDRSSDDRPERAEGIANKYNVHTAIEIHNVASMGLPVVLDVDGIKYAISGNTRTAALKLFYIKHTTKDGELDADGQAVRNAIIEEAAKHGVDARGIKLPVPVLTLIKTTPISLSTLVGKLNKGSVSAKDKNDTSKSDADWILKHPDFIASLRFHPNGEIDEDKSGDAIRRFEEDVLGSDVSMKGEGKKLTEDGKAKIQNAVLVAMMDGVSDPQVMKMIINDRERLDSGLVIGAVVQAAPLVYELKLNKAKAEFDISDDLAQAIAAYVRWRDANAKKLEAARHEGKVATKFAFRSWEGKKTSSFDISWKDYKALLKSDFISKLEGGAEQIADLLAAAEYKRRFNGDDSEINAGRLQAIDLITDYFARYTKIANHEATEDEGGSLFGDSMPQLGKADIMKAVRTTDSGSMRFSVASLWNEDGTINLSPGTIDQITPEIVDEVLEDMTTGQRDLYAKMLEDRHDRKAHEKYAWPMTDDEISNMSNAFRHVESVRDADFIMPDGTLLKVPEGMKHAIAINKIVPRPLVIPRTGKAVVGEDGNYILDPGGLMSLYAAVKSGVVRIASNHGGLEIEGSRDLTDEQIERIYQYVEWANGIGGVDGFSIDYALNGISDSLTPSVTYGKGTSATTVMRDLDAFQQTGAIPGETKSAYSSEYDQFFSREYWNDGNFSVRTEAPPVKVGKGYKVFVRKADGKLYPPMVANPNGEDTPIGVWLNADEGTSAPDSKTGRRRVKAGGKGTNGGSGSLSYRPGWHLGVIPYALQFNVGEKVPNPLGIKNKKGDVIEVGKYFPSNFVWAEVEYAADVDYQDAATELGKTKNGFNNALAGLPYIPVNGSYTYRTNPNPATDPWIITGAMRVTKVLSDQEVEDIVKKAGREPQLREPLKGSAQYDTLKGKTFGGNFSVAIGAKGAERLDDGTSGMHKSVMMLEAGNDRRAAWEKTGWYKGVDGLWRTRVGNGVIAERFEDAKTVGDVLNAPELFKAYPKLGKMKVRYVKLPYGTLGSLGWNSIDMDLDQAKHGVGSAKAEHLDTLKVSTEKMGEVVSYLKKEGMDDVAAEYADKIRDTETAIDNLQRQIESEYKDRVLEVVVHEIQHYIQEQEGFAKGTNVDFERDFAKRRKRDLYDAYDYALDRLSKLWKIKDDGKRAAEASAINARLYSIREMLTEVEDMIQKNDFYPAYFRSAGEVEARYAGVTRNDDASDRTGIAPWEWMNSGERGSVREDQQIVRFSVSGPSFQQVTDEEWDAAKQEFGITDNAAEAGYILPDGTMLDFSEKNNGGPGGMRTLDHRAIGGVILREDRPGEQWRAMEDSLLSGAVRVFPELPGFHLYAEPSADAMWTLREAYDQLKDLPQARQWGVMVEFSTPYMNNGVPTGGYENKSVNYSPSTSSERIAMDIRSFFREGILPEGTFGDGRFSTVTHGNYAGVREGVLNEYRYNQDRAIRRTRNDRPMLDMMLSGVVGCRTRSDFLGIRRDKVASETLLFLSTLGDDLDLLDRARRYFKNENPNTGSVVKQIRDLIDKHGYKIILKPATTLPKKMSLFNQVADDGNKMIVRKMDAFTRAFIEHLAEKTGAVPDWTVRSGWNPTDAKLPNERMPFLDTGKDIDTTMNEAAFIVGGVLFNELPLVHMANLTNKVVGMAAYATYGNRQLRGMPVDVDLDNSQFVLNARPGYDIHNVLTRLCPGPARKRFRGYDSFVSEMALYPPTVLSGIRDWDDAWRLCRDPESRIFLKNCEAHANNRTKLKTDEELDFEAWDEFNVARKASPVASRTAKTEKVGRAINGDGRIYIGGSLDLLKGIESESGEKLDGAMLADVDATIRTIRDFKSESELPYEQFRSFAVDNLRRFKERHMDRLDFVGWVQAFVASKFLGRGEDCPTASRAAYNIVGKVDRVGHILDHVVKTATGRGQIVFAYARHRDSSNVISEAAALYLSNEFTRKTGRPSRVAIYYETSNSHLYGRTRAERFRTKLTFETSFIFRPDDQVFIVDDVVANGTTFASLLNHMVEKDNASPIGAISLAGDYQMTDISKGQLFASDSVLRTIEELAKLPASTINGILGYEISRLTDPEARGICNLLRRHGPRGLGSSSIDGGGESSSADGQRYDTVYAKALGRIQVRPESTSDFLERDPKTGLYTPEAVRFIDEILKSPNTKAAKHRGAGVDILEVADRKGIDLDAYRSSGGRFSVEPSDLASEKILERRADPSGQFSALTRRIEWSDFPDSMSEVVNSTSLANLESALRYKEQRRRFYQLMGPRDTWTLEKPEARRYAESLSTSIGTMWLGRYLLAKHFGDSENAVKVVRHFVKPGSVRLIQSMLDQSRPKLVSYVQSMEGESLNQIPIAYAALLADAIGADLDERIVKTSDEQNTRADQKDRVAREFTFEMEGVVDANAQYILVDDTWTSGQTLVSMLDYLHARGADVVVLSTIATGRYGKKIKPTSDQLQRVLKKSRLSTVEDANRLVGFDINKATGSELHGYLLQGKSGPGGLTRWFREVNAQLGPFTELLEDTSRGGGGLFANAGTDLEGSRPEARDLNGTGSRPTYNGQAMLPGFGRFSTAFPSLRSMSDDELLSAAIASRIALGDPNHKARAVKMKTVTDQLKSLHPTWDTHKLGVEATRVIGEAQRLAKEIRKDLESGMSQSEVMAGLPDRMKGVYREELRQNAIKGRHIGAYGMKAAQAVMDAAGKVAEEAVAVQTGVETTILENEYGINLSETLMHLAENPFAAKPSKSTEGVEKQNTAREVDEDPDLSPEDKKTEEKEVDKRVADAVDAIASSAREKSERERQNRANRKNAKGHEDEVAAEKDSQDKSEEDDEGGDITGEDPVEVVVKKARVDLNDPLHLAYFVEGIARRYWNDTHNLRPDTDPWSNAVAMQFLRLTAQNIYGKLLREMTYSNSRESALGHIRKFDSVSTAKSLVHEMEYVGGLINRNRIWESQKELTNKLDKILKDEFGASGRFSPDKESLRRKVSAELELQARYVRHAIYLTPAAAAKEAQMMTEQLDRTMVDFHNEGHDPSQSKAVVEITRKLNILREWGSLRYKPVAQINDAIDHWIAVASGEHDDIVAKNIERDNRTINAANALAAAMVNKSRKYSAATERNLVFSDYIVSHMGFYNLLMDLTRYSDGNTAAAAEAIIDYIAREVQKAGDRTAAEKRKQDNAFFAAVEGIYGMPFSKVMAEMSAVDDRFAQFMGESEDGKPIEPTKGRAMQLLVSLLQEGHIIGKNEKGRAVWSPGYHENIVKHGRNGQAKLIKKLLSPADLSMITWLGKWYDENRQELSDVSMALFGVGVYAESYNYWPVKMLLESKGLEKGEAVGWTVFPKALTPRIRNNRDFDTSYDIFSLWRSRMEEGAQWKAHAKLGLELRGIFGRANLQSAIIANHGQRAKNLVLGAITDILAGHGAHDRSTQGAEYIVDKIRGWAALSALGGNVGVMLKQTTSIPAFGFEIGLANTGRYIATAFTPEGIAAMKKLFNSEQRKTRWQVGNSEVVANALNSTDVGWLKKAFQTMMLTNKMGDLVPGMVVGQGILREYLAQGMSEEDAMAQTWMLIERTQQSSRIENQASFQRRNKFGRALYQFLSTQQQYLQYEVRAIRAVAANPKVPARWKKLATAIFLNHFVLASAYFWMGELYKAMLGQEPPEDRLENWVVTCLLGPYGALYVLGFGCTSFLNKIVKKKSSPKKEALASLAWFETMLVDDPMRVIRDTFDEKKSWDDVLEDIGRYGSDFNAAFRDLRKIYKNYISNEEKK